MCRSGEICIGQLVAREPFVLGEERADIGKMIGEDLAHLMKHRVVRRSAATLEWHVLPVSLLRNRSTHIGKELVVKPTGKPAHFDPPPGIVRQESTIAKITTVDLVKVFRDYRSPRGRCYSFCNQDRNGAGRVED